MKPNIVKKTRKSYNDSMDVPDIIEAAERGDIKKIEAALSLGEDVNVQEGATGITPLHAAIAGNHVAAVRYLLMQPDIDLDVKDKFGRSPVGLALSLPHDGVIQELHSAQIEVVTTGNADDNEGGVLDFPKPT